MYKSRNICNRACSGFGNKFSIINSASKQIWSKVGTIESIESLGVYLWRRIANGVIRICLLGMQLVKGSNKMSFAIKKNQAYLILVAIAFSIFGLLLSPLLAPASNIGANPSAGFAAVPVEPVSAEEIYKLVLCPCCGDTIDARCCGMATDMINYVDSQVNAGLSKTGVIIQIVKKYGITSIIESKRAEVEAELAKRSPDLFPTGKLSFNKAVGKQAPDFSLESIDGKITKLSDYKGKVIVLFFNEGEMCYPACWDQMAEFANDKRFNSDNVITFSILVDQKANWLGIVKQVPKLGNAKILFDPTRAVSLAYDVLSLPSSMHPSSYPGHTYFIIDREGVIQYTLDDPNMAIWNDKLVNELEKLTEVR